MRSVAGGAVAAFVAALSMSALLPIDALAQIGAEKAEAQLETVEDVAGLAEVRTVPWRGAREGGATVHGDGLPAIHLKVGCRVPIDAVEQHIARTSRMVLAVQDDDGTSVGPALPPAMTHAAELLSRRRYGSPRFSIAEHGREVL